MKRLLFIWGFSVFYLCFIFSQNVGIGETVFTPHSSAMLEVKSANKGVLIPRVALVQTSQSSPVSNPEQSLLVYNTATVNDVTPGYYYWNGSKWVRLLEGDKAWLLSGNTASSSDFIGTLNDVDFRIFTNNSEKMRITSGGNVGINAVNPASSAILEVKSTEKGVLIPRMTQAQRDAISNPADVLLIFNTTTRCFEWWDQVNQTWVSFGCASPTLPKQCFAFGTTSHDHILSSLYSPVDGGIILAGMTSFGVSNDGYIVKLNSSLNLEWTKVLNGNSYDVFTGIIQTTDNGFLIGGYSTTYSSSTYEDFILIKLSPSGNVEWSKNIGTFHSETCNKMIKTSDGGFVMYGWQLSPYGSERELLIIKFDATGNLQWAKYVGGSNQEYGYFIIQTSDGGFLCGGRTNSFGSGDNDYYVCKLDANGNKQWIKAIGTSNVEFGYSAVQTEDGGYIVCGITYPSASPSSYNAIVVKLDNSGNLVWNKVFSGANFGEIKYHNGYYYLLGKTRLYGAGGEDGYIVKIDQAGNVYGAKTFGNTGTESFSTIYPLINSNDLFIIGSTTSYGSGNADFAVITTDVNFTSCCLANSTYNTTTGVSVVDVTSSTQVINATPYMTVSSFTGSWTSGGTKTLICQ